MGAKHSNHIREKAGKSSEEKDAARQKTAEALPTHAAMAAGHGFVSAAMTAEVASACGNYSKACTWAYAHDHGHGHARAHSACACARPRSCTSTSTCT